MADKEHVIIFDGVCRLCNGFVNFILKQDKRKVFKFSFLQSDFGKEIAGKTDRSNFNFDSVIYYCKGKTYIKSTAALMIFKDLGFPYNILSLFKIFPVSIRDAVYDFIARNRYKWFGKNTSCMIPLPEDTNRFID